MKNPFFEKIVQVIGIMAFLMIVVSIYRFLVRSTETRIISNKARSVLSDKGKALELRKAVDKYHETGDWSQTNIKQIL